MTGANPVCVAKGSGERECHDRCTEYYADKARRDDAALHVRNVTELLVILITWNSLLFLSGSLHNIYFTNYSHISPVILGAGTRDLLTVSTFTKPTRI
jgi:hypothetical protein